MNLRIGSSYQVNGSLFQLGDVLGIVISTPIILGFVNPFVQRVFGKFTFNGKLTVGYILGVLSVLLAACFEVLRRAAPILPEASNCAPRGVNMSDFPAWLMFIPFFLTGVAEVYVNPTLYFLSYSQAPPPLRSSMQAITLYMNALSSSIFTFFTQFMTQTKDLNEAHLDWWYYFFLGVFGLFATWYYHVCLKLVEKNFEEHTSGIKCPARWEDTNSNESVDARARLL